MRGLVLYAQKREVKRNTKIHMSCLSFPYFVYAYFLSKKLNPLRFRWFLVLTLFYHIENCGYHQFLEVASY